MKLENTYTNLNKMFYKEINNQYDYDAEYVLINENVAKSLDLTVDEIRDNLNFFVGNEGGVAQGYAGHQFGHLSILGDGRAMVVGETIENKHDIQLKGSGPTPYSRGGDGRATLYSMLREYLISEALFHLDVPTTRSLAVITTGKPVERDKTHQGAILVRTAKSHIRVGTFEYAATMGPKQVEELAVYSIERHYSDAKDYLDFYKKIVVSQAKLIAKWMSIGFVHGVMNTDNMLISGESIDYGPCAFMNEYSLETVFSSIDHQGRYRYGNQPYIGSWNLARLAEAMLPLFGLTKEESLQNANNALKLYETTYRGEYIRLMGEKIGIRDDQLIYELLKRMDEGNLDYTNTFIQLTEHHAHFALGEWVEKWLRKKPDFELMKKVNPRMIPRNNIVEEALREAEFSHDLSMFHKLLYHIQNPFEDAPEEWSRPGEHVTTFCGT